MIDNVLSAGRGAAESLMLDTCRITRSSGEPVWDEGTGTYTPAAASLLYEGRCKVQTYQAFESTPEAGERRITIQRYYLHVPVQTNVAPSEVVKYQSGDDVEILTSAHNPALPGTRFVVQGAHDKSLQTAHRLLVDEVLPRG